MNTNAAEAASRLRRIRACVEKSQDIYGVPVDATNRQSIHDAARIVKRKMLDDERTVIDAYLSEHPADGEQEITEEWLRSVGFVYDDEMESWLIFAPQETREVPADDDGYEVHEKTALWPLTFDANFENWQFGESWLPCQTTRRDVRALASALGIVLKEGGGI